MIELNDENERIKDIKEKEFVRMKSTLEAQKRILEATLENN